MTTHVLLVAALLTPALGCESHDPRPTASSAAARAVPAAGIRATDAKQSSAAKPAEPAPKPSDSKRKPRPVRPNYLLM